MKLASKEQAAIVRTERGLTVAGTRITLYDVMDYVKRKYSPEFIGNMLDLTDAQVNAALSYINVHRAEVEVEYQIVLQEAEELRRYYQERNRELLDRIAAKPPKPGTEAIRAKLASQRNREHEFIN